MQAIFSYHNPFAFLGSFLSLYTVTTAGIAATRLTGGTTVHNLFRLPVNEDATGCDDDTGAVRGPRLSYESEKGALLRNASLIVIDEKSMMTKGMLEAVNVALQSAVGCEGRLFGGKVREPSLLMLSFSSMGLQVAVYVSHSANGPGCGRPSFFWDSASS